MTVPRWMFHRDMAFAYMVPVFVAWYYTHSHFYRPFGWQPLVQFTVYAVAAVTLQLAFARIRKSVLQDVKA